MKKYLISRVIFFLLLLSNTSKAQDNIKESSKELINSLYKKYYTHALSNIDSALYYAEHLYNRSNELKNKDWIGIANYSMGFCYNAKWELDKAYAYYNKSLQIAKEVNNDSLVFKSMRSISEVEILRGNYKNAILNYERALAHPNIKDYPRLYLSIASHLIKVYIELNDFTKAQKYLAELNALKSSGVTNFGIAEAYYNAGLAYLKINKDSSKYYFNKSLELSKNNNYNMLHIYTLTYLSSIYLNEEKSSVEGFKMLKTAQSLSHKYNRAYFLGLIYSLLGSYYLGQENIEATITYYKKFKNLIGNNEHRYSFFIDLLEGIVGYYNERDEHSKAYPYLKELQELKEQISLEQDSYELQELQVKYDVEHKNNEIARLNQEKKLVNTQRRWLLVTCIIVLITLAVILITLNQRLKTERALREKEQEQLKQNREMQKITGEIEGQELERRRISKELHDGISMKLAVAKLNLNLIKDKTPEVEQSAEDIGEVMQEVRTISHNLSSHYLEGKDIIESLQSLFLEIKRIKSIEIDATIYPADVLKGIDNHSKHHIYRIFQELLMNVIKHSQATRVEVCILEEGSNYSFMFTDNGIGVYNLEKVKGIGLRNIESRIRSMQGNLEIESQVKKGTTFSFSIPKE